MAESHSEATDTGCENSSQFDSPIDAGSSSYHLSFPSEPPDIRNWFSSYKYESPDSSDLPNDLGCFKLVETDDSETQDPSRLVILGSQIEEKVEDSLQCLPVSDQKSEDESCPNCDRSYLKRRQNLLAEFKIICDDGDKSNMECNKAVGVLNSGEDFDQYVKRPAASLKRKQNLQPQLENRCILKETKKKDVDCKTEEAVGNASADGFISTKKREVQKSKQGSHPLSANNENRSVLKRAKETTHDLTLKENNGILRGTGNTHDERDRVLADRSNIQIGDEVIGKWQCPRKNKPHVGPPMKQLRLEQWVRRVN